MATGRIGAYREEVEGRVRVALAEDHPPRLIAVSFAIGLFVTTLPSLGSGLVLLGWLGYQFEWANKLAFLAAVAILNPLAKSSVYVASYATGRLFLGPIPGVTLADVDLSAGRDVLTRVLLGNVIVGVVLAVVGYGVAYRAVNAYRARSDA